MKKTFKKLISKYRRGGAERHPVSLDTGCPEKGVGRGTPGVLRTPGVVALAFTLAAILTAGGFLAAQFGFFSGGTNAPSVPSDTMTRGLVGYWEFEEGTGQTVHNAANTGSVNDGTLGADTDVDTDDPAWGKGKNGGGMEFDGDNDFVNCGSDESFGVTEFTIEAWVFIGAVPTGNKEIISKKDFGFRLLIDENTSKFSLNIYDTDLNWKAAKPTDTYTVNKWHHVVATRSSNGTLICYQDAIPGTSSSSANPKTNNNLVALGIRAVDLSTDPFNGSIDSVRIYNRALSAEEVRYHYNRGGPVASWGFDEGSGTVVHDSSGNGFDGVLTP